MGTSNLKEPVDQKHRLLPGAYNYHQGWRVEGSLVAQALNLRNVVLSLGR